MSDSEQTAPSATSGTERSDAVGRVVATVTAEAVREARMEGVVLAAPPGPERRLLETWLGSGGAGRIVVPSTETAHGVARALGDASVLAGWVATAHALAAKEPLLVASTATKTLLLLESRRHPADLHPLGDVWASEVLEWTGDCTLPLPVGGAGGAAALGEVERVDRALRAWTEGATPLREALAELPSVRRRELERLLQRPLPCGRPALVPKLTSWTLGVDPPL